MTITVNTNYDKLRSGLIAWLTTYAGVNDVIFSNQAELRPAKPYASLLITSDGIRFGFDYVDESFDVPTQLIQRMVNGPRQMNVQVEVYSDPATATGQLEAAERLNNALLVLDMLPVRDAFKTAGLSFIRHTSINRLDEQLGQRWERRAQMDVTLLYRGETFDDGGGGSGDWIQTVPTPTEANGNATYNT